MGFAAALANYVGQAGISGLGPADRVLQFASVSSDISVEEIFPCLMGGGLVLRRLDAGFGCGVLGEMSRLGHHRS